jgi:DUF1680 family protein
MVPWALVVAVAVVVTCAVLVPADASPRLGPVQPRFRALSGAEWRFKGPLGERIERNVEQWILRAPEANPGMLDMFRRRDRHWPYAEHTPWAGEFAGKYLISAVQACRMTTGSPRFARDEVRRSVGRFVEDLIATQDKDGYMGPWPVKRRLMGDCDLWGHYHCMLGLLMWYDDTGDKAALRSVLRAADRICRQYVDGGRRPIEAGNPCFNMSVIHIMAELYRRTGDARCLAMVRCIEEDMPKDGNWLAGGIEGVPYWRLPSSGPRWEALHAVQGFVTMYQATGDDRYRTAALNHWRSIRDLDRHPSGAFSTNEQANGTVFGLGSIETCCSVAWMALTADVLRMTGDPLAADELELTLWNQALAAQHPSGSWCTYDTPLNGVRAPSYQQISFQYRPGSPELNCCSVNSPRTLGMLSEWAVTACPDGVAVNFYGPCEIVAPIGARRSLKVTQKTAYPVEGKVRLNIEGDGKPAVVMLRIPAWSARTTLKVNGKPWPEAVRPGSYVTIKRKWAKGDTAELEFDMSPRLALGEGPDRGGRVAIHRGPLLLAFDAGLNPIEVGALKPIDVTSVRLEPAGIPDSAGAFPPIGAWKIETDGGGAVVLCDFASAGAQGTEYAAWLPASHALPPPPRLDLPADGTLGKPGPILFRWTSSGSAEDRYDLIVARDAEFTTAAVRETGLTVPYATIERGLQAAGEYYWKVVARNATGEIENRGGPRRFRVNPAARDRFLAVRADGCLAASALDGSGAPECGVLTLAQGLAPAPDRHGTEGRGVALTGTGSGLRYRIPYFPETDYSFMGWVCPSPNQTGLRQVFSAWCRGMDDPLRVTIEGREVSARIEAGAGFRTAGVAIEPGRWVHLAAVKQGTSLRLYVDGARAGAAAVPERVRSQAVEVGVGFNPLFSGGENLEGAFDDFALFARALTDQEIADAARAGK